MFKVISFSFALILIHAIAFSNPKPPLGMVYIPKGEFIPLFQEEESNPILIHSFYLDIYPVTNQDFLVFVKQNPKWRKSNIKKIFAEHGYLKDWPTDLSYPEGSANRPVTYVSWFAAKAYAKFVGKRLPTRDEWEFVSMASSNQPNGMDDPIFRNKVLEWYARPDDSHLPEVGMNQANFYGVHDMFGVVWEWTQDFNAMLVTGESRGDSDLERNLFCGSGALGATDVKNYAAFMRQAFWSSLQGKYIIGHLGFRCAKDIK